MLRRTDEAVRAFRTVLGLSPGQDETISMGLAYAFARAGQPDSALALIEDAPCES